MTPSKELSTADAVTLPVSCLILTFMGVLVAVELYRARQRMPIATYSRFIQITFACITFLLLVRAGFMFIPLAAQSITALPLFVGNIYLAFFVGVFALFEITQTFFVSMLFELDAVDDVARDVVRKRTKIAQIAVGAIGGIAAIVSLISIAIPSASPILYRIFVFFQTLIAVYDIALHLLMVVSFTKMFDGLLLVARTRLIIACVAITIFVILNTVFASKASFNFTNLFSVASNVSTTIYAGFSYTGVKFVREGVHDRVVAIQRQLKRERREKKRDERLKRDDYEDNLLDPRKAKGKKGGSTSPGAATAPNENSVKVEIKESNVLNMELERNQLIFDSLNTILATQLNEASWKKKSKRIAKTQTQLAQGTLPIGMNSTSKSGSALAASVDKDKQAGKLGEKDKPMELKIVQPNVRVVPTGDKRIKSKKQVPQETPTIIGDANVANTIVQGTASVSNMNSNKTKVMSGHSNSQLGTIIDAPPTKYEPDTTIIAPVMQATSTFAAAATLIGRGDYESAVSEPVPKLGRNVHNTATIIPGGNNDYHQEPENTVNMRAAGIPCRNDNQTGTIIEPESRIHLASPPPPRNEPSRNFIAPNINPTSSFAATATLIGGGDYESAVSEPDPMPIQQTVPVPPIQEEDNQSDKTDPDDE